MTVTSSRRTLLRLAGVTAGASVVATAAAPGAASAAAGIFQHGIASGDPLPGGILLWTRVTPTPESTPASGAGPVVAVDWQVAADSSFSTVVAAGTVSTGPDRDHTVKVDVAGLAPATTYWYRFGLAGDWSPTGRTMTAPAGSADISRLRAGVVSCANWESGYFAAYRRLAERGDLNLVAHLGDYIYEYGTGEFTAGGTVVRKTQPANETVTLTCWTGCGGRTRSSRTRSRCTRPGRRAAASTRRPVSSPGRPLGTGRPRCCSPRWPTARTR